MESSQAPLISNRSREENELEYDADDATDTASNASHRHPDARPGLFVVLLTFAAGISGLLFGCASSSLSLTHTFPSSSS